MTKKTYVSPAITVEKLQVRTMMLDGSPIDVSSSSYNESTNGPVRSRRNDSFWDDDEY